MKCRIIQPQQTKPKLNRLFELKKRYELVKQLFSSWEDAGEDLFENLDYSIDKNKHTLIFTFEYSTEEALMKGVKRHDIIAPKFFDNELEHYKFKTKAKEG